MTLWLYQLSTTLAQVVPYDDPDRVAPPEPPKRPLSFSDLQQGLRAYGNGETTSNYFRWSLIGMVIAFILVAIFLSMRQRRNEGGPPDSTRKLAWELTRKLRFPLTTRLILAWVSKSAQVPLATLLISSAAFDNAVTLWSQQNTFAMLRRWGSKRLTTLKPTLFN